MGMNFSSISTTGGASGGTVSDSWEAIGGSPVTIAIRASGSMGTHYTVPNGKRFTGYIQNNNGQVAINGTEIAQNFWMYQQYYYNKKIIRLNAGDVVSTTSNGAAYVNIVGTESSL